MHSYIVRLAVFTTIVNALAFYHAHHIQGALMDEDEREQYMLAFQEDGPTLVDSLATRVANTY
jgi:hypothetical protein